MKLTLKKKIGAAATAVAIIGGAGIASAYWTSAGTGEGSAATGVDTAWEVASGTDDILDHPDLTPGGPSDTVDVHVTNNSEGNQGLGSVAIKVAGTATGGSSEPWVVGVVGTCDADDFAVGELISGVVVYALPGATLTHTHALAVNVAPGATHTDMVRVKMVNKADTNQDACKGVTVPLYISAS